jgi:3-oxoadipate enol-lactonase
MQKVQNRTEENMDIIANRTRFWYEESGKGHPVICIHGNGLNRQLWRHLAPKLSPKYRTIIYELRGMGESETVGIPGLKFSIKDHGDDLGAIMDAMGIDKAAIVAHAFGSFVSMKFAADHPERVSAMVVFCTSAKIESKTKDRLPRWVEIVEKEGMDPLIEEAMDRWFVDSFKQAHPEIIDLYREMVGANPRMGYAANCRGIIEYDIRDELARITCPTLVVTGESDRSTPPEDHRLIADRIPNCRLVVVKNASHTVPEEQPEEFNRLVLEFFSQQLKDGTSGT